MKLTNVLNLPQPLVDAVNNDSYRREEGVLSITTLLKPPRIVALEARHYAELSQDASERIWSLLGQVVHGILERADTTGLSEQRFYAEINGQRISGQVDRYADKTLQDYKFISAWKLKDGCPQEFEEQLNCYAYLLNKAGHPVEKIELVGILRDWSKMEAFRSPDYPQKQVIIIDVPVWDEAKTKKFITHRISMHKEALKTLPKCTPEDVWAKPDKFAVMKKGRKSALKLHDTLDSAEIHAKTDKSLYVEERKGVSVRCEHYCPVNVYCDQYKEEKNK